MVGNLRTVFQPGGLCRAASLVAAAMIAPIGALTMTLSASAAGPPIDGHTSPNDARCVRIDPENLFFINMPTPSSGNPSPGSTIGTWFSDESGLNQGSANPSSPFHLFFHLTGPGVSKNLTADTTESFNQISLFNTTHKECKIQVNIKTVIPATINGGAYPPGDYTVTMTAWDNDQTRQGGDHSTQTWNFRVASPQPSPTPTSQPSPTPQVLPTSQASPVSQVQGASTTNGPGLPRAGAGAGTSGPDLMIGTGLLLAAVGAVARAIRTPRRRRLP
jgi:hypothetical protein